MKGKELSEFEWVRAAEARELARTREQWVFPGVISTATTLIYGRSSVGKSFLVANMVRSLLLPGEKFLGMEPKDANKEWRPGIICTDPGTLEEYGEDRRLHFGRPEDEELDVDLLQVGTIHGADKWQRLTGELADRGRNFVVVDNLGGVTGDSNETAAVNRMYDGLNDLVSEGVPVVILHHESEKGWNPSRGASPMGSSSIVQKARVWIQARVTSRKGFRGGNLGLYVQANRLDQPYEFILKPQDGPYYEIANQGSVTDTSKPPQERAPEVYDRNQAIADFIRDNCPDASKSEKARKVAEAFPEVSESSVRLKLLSTSGPVTKLLEAA